MNELILFASVFASVFALGFQSTKQFEHFLMTELTSKYDW